MGSKLKSLVLAGCSFPLVFRYAQAAHLTVSQKPGEPLSLYIMAGGGLALIFPGFLFLLGVFLSRGVKKGWGLIASGAALIIIGAIITAEREEGGAAIDHRLFSLPLILLLVFFGLGVFLLLFWAYRTGQFKEMEGVKHRMLERELGFLYDSREKDGGEPDE